MMIIGDDLIGEYTEEGGSLRMSVELVKEDGGKAGSLLMSANLMLDNCETGDLGMNRGHMLSQSMTGGEM